LFEAPRHAHQAELVRRLRGLHLPS
jgi:hypothetical protein